MEDRTTLIPAPPVVREKLARNIREGELLRSLLRLSIRAAEERRRCSAPMGALGDIQPSAEPDAQ